MAIRVLHMGLGPIGLAVVKQVANRKGFKSVGAVDIDPAKLGKDLGEVAGLDKKLKVTVSDKVAATIKATKPDVVALCTSSSLEEHRAAARSADEGQGPGRLDDRGTVVSVLLEQEAGEADRSRWPGRPAWRSLGTGVNPGFVMDALPITLTGVCERVEAIRVDRIQDARSRRLPFQQKIGSGLTPEEFKAKVEAGTVRHVGLTESIAMIADAMGWKLDRITDEIEPKIAAKPVSSQFLTVKKGQVCGIIQDGVGYRMARPIVTLHMEAYLGAPESYDAVRVDGSPALTMKIAGGVHGDVATASITVNSMPKVIDAPAGLHTMRSLPIPSFFGG